MHYFSIKLRTVIFSCLNLLRDVGYGGIRADIWVWRVYMFCLDFSWFHVVQSRIRWVMWFYTLPSWINYLHFINHFISRMCTFVASFEDLGLKGWCPPWNRREWDIGQIKSRRLYSGISSCIHSWSWRLVLYSWLESQCISIVVLPTTDSG